MDPGKSDIWAITTLFNPSRYQRRLENFRVFRQRLTVPLVAVELSFDGKFELGREDADILIHIQGGAVLWQKERLLNIALSKVPTEVSNIAWLDADVILEDAQWPERACSMLKNVPVMQLFSELVDLEPTWNPAEELPARPTIRGTSVAQRVLTGTATTRDFCPDSTPGFRHTLFGLAWAARRDFLETHGFYDGMIIGSGDRVMACAAVGRFEEAIRAARLNPSRAAHYLRWAQPYYQALLGRIGCSPGHLYHLWHGDIADRRYLERHEEFAKLPFDPTTDLRIGASGCWEWASEKPALHALLARYFADRNEDGVGKLVS